MSTTETYFKESDYVKSIDDEGNLILTLDGNLYDRHRPEGITAEVEKSVDDYRQVFVAKVIEEAGDIVAKAMKKDKAIKHASVVCRVTKGFDLEASIQRERDGWNPKTREPLVTYGSISVKMTTPFRKVGPIKVACTSMSSKIKDALS